ncbi:MAG: DUF4197 domain-containing protein [Desulfurivibrio sp.]|jgi:hypothetical protein|nr:MAG: DUF4197 domain-containing protein [Desulfurivibrio sp.]
MTFPLKCFQKSAVVIAISGCLTIPLFSPADQVQAQGSWLEQGSKILGTVQSKKGGSSLSNAEIGGAFKDALHIGTANVVSRLGSLDGFNADPAIHIPLPSQLDTAKKMLSQVGMSHLLDDLELKLNRAAEAATPKAKELFWQAINDMTFDDVMKIYKGPKDSATQYFQRKMTPALTREMQPIVQQSLSEVGAVQSYDNVMAKYKTLPFVPDVNADLTSYTVEKGLNGIFHYVASEEAAIRENPARQTTDLLKKVFGGK